MDEDDEQDKTKLYTLHTRATYQQVSDAMVELTMKTKQVVFLEEQPNGFAVIAPRPVWTPGRWLAAIAVLAASPFVFRFASMAVTLTPLQGFGIGWIAAALVLLLNRSPWKGSKG